MDDFDTGPGDTIMHLQPDQARIISAVERTGASLSMVGVILIIVTFALFKRLRTVPNTFILFASIANIGASIASLIGLAGIEAGETSPLCQTQAFLLEMFMQSDPWWSFAMAVNVFMVFFFSTNPLAFRRYLWVYCLICFGLPMIPAAVCLAIKHERGPIYGNATLWCWIGDNWNSLRIFSYYIPIWICIFFSALIYVAVGYHVFHSRNQLRNLTLSNQGKDVSSSDVRDSGEKNLTSNPTYYGTVTTEVQVTTDPCDGDAITLAYPPYPTHALPMGYVIPPTPLSSAILPAAACPQTYPWSEPAGPSDLESGISTVTTAARTFGPSTAVSNAPTAVSDRGRSASTPTSHRPSSAPPHHVSSCTSAGAATDVAGGASGSRSSCRAGKKTGARRLRHAWRRFLSKLRHTDPVKLAYLRTSFVFAISVLVTWTPSSINRVYALIHPAEVSYALNVASAAVLPLQGVWNAVIYFTTSWRILGEEVRATAGRSAPGRWVLRRTGRGDGGRGGSEGAFRSMGRYREDGFEREARWGRAGGHRPADSTEMEFGARGLGTVRVQRGCELDSL